MAMAQQREQYSHEVSLRDKVSRFLLYTETLHRQQLDDYHPKCHRILGCKLSTHLSLLKSDPSTKVFKNRNDKKIIVIDELQTDFLKI